MPAAAHYPSVTEYQAGLTPNGAPWDIVDGDDGKLWFTEDALGAFGRLSAGDGLIGEFGGVLLAGSPKGIAAGPDGNLWIAEAGGNGAIARVTRDGGVTEFSAGLTAGDPWDITAGPDGNLWFVSQSPAFIGRITPDGTITEFSAGLTPSSQPSAITAGPDGNLWFTESADPGRSAASPPTASSPRTASASRRTWSRRTSSPGPTATSGSRSHGDPGAIGRITPEGVFKTFDKQLTPGRAPHGHRARHRRRDLVHRVGKPRPHRAHHHLGRHHRVHRGPHADRSPWMITPGPDGNMWFTENANPGALARISLPPAVRTRDVGSAVSDNSALLRAKVRPNAQATEYYFEYGQGESFSLKSQPGSAGDGWDFSEVTMRVANLKPGKQYHYRVVATNGSGTSVGGAGEFTTHELEPELGEVVVAEPTGRVRFKRPGGRWRRLAGVGGRAARGHRARHPPRQDPAHHRRAQRQQQTGTFGGGVVQVRQPRRARGRVDLHLRGGNFARLPGRSPRRAAPAWSRAPRAAAASAGSGAATAAAASAPTGGTATRPCAARAGSPRTAATARSRA